MTPTENLFIRACKTRDPYKRVRSVYRRFYGRYDGQETDKALTAILARLCDKYNPFETADLLTKISPGNFFPEMRWRDRVLGVLIDRIRYTRTGAFPGLRAPTQFSRKYNFQPEVKINE